MAGHVLFVVLGGLCAAAGGELFVRGAVRLSAILRVHPSVIGVTVAAFATSTPEFSVALQGALDGQPAIPLGDALGSNVANFGLILGLTLLMTPLVVRRESVRRELLVALLAPVILGLLLLDGVLNRFDGVVLLSAFCAWFVMTIARAPGEHLELAEGVGRQRLASVIVVTAVGLFLLAVAGRLLVVGAKGVGDELGADPFILGATLVAFATSAPELATTIVSAYRRQAVIGLGTLLGSNIFNALCIVGLVATIEPITVAAREILWALVAGSAVVLLATPNARGVLGRPRGGALVAAYAGYTLLLALGSPAN